MAGEFPELRVAVGYSLRYYPLNIRVRQMLWEGVIGRIVSIEATHNHPHDCTHLFDREPGTERVPSDRGGQYLPGSEMAGPTMS